MSFEKLFNLKTNPFRITPATINHEIVWAGFPNLKSKLEKRLQKSMKIPSSSLVLNWGEYGSGKTHAARFFNKKNVLKELANNINEPIPLSFVFNLPKSKNPIYELFSSILDQLDIEHIRNIYKDDINEVHKFVDETVNNLQIRNIIKAFFSDLDSRKLKQYLYGFVTKSDLKEFMNYEILRPINSDNDYIEVLASLFSCLTQVSNKYSSVIIWIDEFEDIITHNNNNIDRINDFIREMLDSTPNKLLIFLNLTQSPFINIEDVGEFLAESVKSRIRERINFEIPTKNDIYIYLEELLNDQIFRIGNVTNKYQPFEEEVIEAIYDELGNSSLRKYNETFSMLIELAEIEGVNVINKEFLKSNKEEIFGWKD